jgi:hypothetical protein
MRQVILEGFCYSRAEAVKLFETLALKVQFDASGLGSREVALVDFR